MELKFRKDIFNVVTKTDIERRNKIIEEVNKRGYIQKGEADYLLSFDKKVRVCNSCGKTYEEAKAWIFATAQDKSGKALNIGLFQNCFLCDMENINNKK